MLKKVFINMSRHILSDYQKQQHTDACTDLIATANGDTNFLKNVTVGDES